MDFVALGFASQSLVAALGGATSLSTNVLVAHYWNHEVLFNTDVAGVVCIVLGAFIFAVTAEESEDFDLAELENNFVSAGFMIYIAIQLVAILFFLATIADSVAYRWRSRFTEGLMRPLVHRMQQIENKFESRILSLQGQIDMLEKKLRDTQYKMLRGSPAIGVPGTPPGAWPVEPEDDVNFSLDGATERTPMSIERSKSDSAMLDRPRQHWMDQFVYAGCSGVIGALSVLFGGCVSKVVVESLSEENQFTRLTPLVFLVGMIVCVLSQTHFLNKAMMVGDNMSVIPTFSAFWTTFGVLGGVIFYKQGAVNLLGLVFMIIGVAFLVQHARKRQTENEQNEEHGPEQDYNRLGIITEHAEATPVPERLAE